jgi:hypothetical protein
MPTKICQQFKISGPLKEAYKLPNDKNEKHKIQLMKAFNYDNFFYKIYAMKIFSSLFMP